MAKLIVVSASTSVAGIRSSISSVLLLDCDERNQDGACTLGPVHKIDIAGVPERMHGGLHSCRRSPPPTPKPPDRYLWVVCDSAPAPPQDVRRYLRSVCIHR